MFGTVPPKKLLVKSLSVKCARENTETRGKLRRTRFGATSRLILLAKLCRLNSFERKPWAAKKSEDCSVEPNPCKTYNCVTLPFEQTTVFPVQFDIESNRGHAVELHSAKRGVLKKGLVGECAKRTETVINIHESIVLRKLQWTCHCRHCYCRTKDKKNH